MSIRASDLRGAGRLVVAAVAGVTDVVEGMHRNIARVSPIIGNVPTGRAGGIAGLVYGSIRGITQAVGAGLDLALALLESPGSRNSSPGREAVLAAINGVFGDYLVAAGNPLAIPMTLRQAGRPLVLERQALSDDIVDPQSKLLVLVHGLCMNDLQWRRTGHEHGAALARELGYTAIHLHYNSGRHISDNGREFADILEALLREWPVPIGQLSIIGHSMGGLVARSAHHQGSQAGHAWPKRMKKLFFLGTPHHGAPLERAGSHVDLLAGISPYTEPLSRLGKIRSAGIQDLRHGDFLDTDLNGRGSNEARWRGAIVPLPRDVACFAIAASRQARPGGARRLPAGDGLVPVASALGWHDDASRALSIPAARQAICYGLNHFDLLGSRAVYDHLRRWLATDQ